MGCCNDNNMTPWERFRLSPFQKWSYYGLPPWKFILNVLLILASTSQIYLINNYVTPYYRSQVQNWQEYLAVKELVGDDTFSMTEYWIFKIDDLIDQVNYTTRQYYILNEVAVRKFEFFTIEDENNKTSSSVPVPLHCEVEYYKSGLNIFDAENKLDGTLTKETYNLTLDDLGPFSKTGEELNTFVHTLHHFKLQFRVKSVGKGSDTCWINKVVQEFSFEDRGRVDMKVQPDLALCETEQHKNLSERDIFPVLVVFILLFILSFVSQILLFKAICNHMKSYKHFKDIHDRWEDLPIRAKLKFFNLWFFITSFGNVANIIASLTAYNFLTQYSRFQWDLIILLTGFGCMMCWISIIQYLEHFPRYYYLILTLRLSTPRLAKFLVGVLPVFLGFAFFGVAYFAAYSDLFKDPGASSVTLFALLNGDVIHDVFDDIYDASPTISRIYLYVFIILFIYAVLNIFIAIVEDAFFAARRTFVEDLQKDLADRIKDPKDMDILGLLEGPPVPDPSLGQPQENKYSGLSFMQNQSMLNLLNEQQPTYENILEEPLVREPEPFELRSSRYVTNRESATVLKELFDSYMGEITNEINNLVVINDKYLTPPHSARFYPCAEENCIYCRMKDLFAANLEELKERTTEEFKLVREFQPDHVNMGIQNAEARWRESFSTVTTVDSFEGLDDIETTPQVNAKRSPTDDKSDLQKILQ